MFFRWMVFHAFLPEERGSRTFTKARSDRWMILCSRAVMRRVADKVDRVVRFCSQVFN